jgi:DNA-directed RNA polymerase specialized sigma subunit
MDNDLVVKYQAIVHRVALKYKHAMHKVSMVDFEQELWVWLLELLREGPKLTATEVYQNLMSEAKRRLKAPYVTPQRNMDKRTLQQKAKGACDEYLSTLEYPERAVFTWLKMQLSDKQIAERLEITYQSVAQKRKVLILNFKVFLRRYLDRA